MAGEAANEGGGRTDHDSKCIHLKTFYQKSYGLLFSQDCLHNKQLEGRNSFVREKQKLLLRDVSCLPRVIKDSKKPLLD